MDGGMIGRWRIVEMELWDRDAIDPLGPAFLEFRANQQGEFRFVAVHGFMDVRYASEDGLHRADFSWEGEDEMDPASGRGWAIERADGSLTGRIFLHMGEDSEFLAEPTEL
jgi:hypothetical protein